MNKAIVGALAAAGSTPFVGLLLAMVTLGAGAQAGASTPLDPAPSALAAEDIPAHLLAAYREAGLSCPGLPWTVIAGIGKVESDHGRHGGATVSADGTVTPPIYGIILDGSTPGTIAVPLPSGGSPWHNHPTWDRALGPMQFLTATFQAVGVDGNGDGDATPHNAVDAIFSAAAYLCPEGEVTSLRDAIYRYNRSQLYVDEVLDWAARYAAVPLYAGADPLALVAHPNVTMGDGPRADLLAGRIDPQLVAILLSLANDHTFYISSLITGHSVCVNGTGTYPDCTISRHASGRAADLWLFDGAVVTDTNAAARAQLLTWHALDRTTEPLRPWAIGHPFGDLAGAAPGSFNDADHEDHFHLAVVGGISPTRPTAQATPPDEQGAQP